MIPQSRLVALEFIGMAVYSWASLSETLPVNVTRERSERAECLTVLSALIIKINATKSLRCANALRDVRRK